MEFNRNQNKPVIALLGAGAMGTAIARRIGANKTILLGDVSEEKLTRRAQELRENGFSVEMQIVDALDPDSVHAFAGRATELGEVKYYIHTAGASPSQASPERILALDLIATAAAIDEFAAAGDSYQRMIDASAARRVGTVEEIAAAGAFLLSDEAAFITGTDLLIDGGVIAAIQSGLYQLNVR